MPRERAQRDAYIQTVGEDGYAFLDAVEAAETPAGLRDLPSLAMLRHTWHQQYERQPAPQTPATQPAPATVRFKTLPELPRAGEGLQSPYDPEARYRQKRDTGWVGSMVHVSETCEPTLPPLLTHVHTTTAAVHEAQCTEAMHQALDAKGLAPDEHWVNAAYVDAGLLVQSQDEHSMQLRGPTRPNPAWNTHVAEAYTLTDFTIDWAHQQVQCPQGT